MSRGRELPLQLAAEGVGSGMAGALALTGVMILGRKAMAHQGVTARQRGDQGLTAGEALSEGPAIPPSMNEVTATFVQKLATGLFGSSLSTEQQFSAGVAWHLFYGGFWGMLYALLTASIHAPRPVRAFLFGLGVWAVGPAWLVPKMKLMLPPGSQEPRTTALVVVGHLLYALLVDAGLRALRLRDGEE